MSEVKGWIEAGVVFAVLDGAIDTCEMAKGMGGNADVIDFRQRELEEIRKCLEGFVK